MRLPHAQIVLFMQKRLIRGYAVFHASRAGTGSNTIKSITYSRGQRMDKSNAVKINKRIYLVTFLHITKKSDPYQILSSIFSNMCVKEFESIKIFLD